MENKNLLGCDLTASVGENKDNPRFQVFLLEGAGKRGPLFPDIAATLMP